MGQKMRCISGFATRIDGFDYLVGAGDIADADHPVVLRAPANWEPLKTDFQVEEATAAPGKKRAASVKSKAE